MGNYIYKLFAGLGRRGFFNWLSDSVYIRIAYFIKFKKNLNLKNPKTFNEKLQWLKLHDRKKIYCDMVDKYEVKKYISKVIGDKYCIPTIGIYSTFEEIDFDKLPNQFVIKCTHDSGSVVVVKDKKSVDIKKIKKKIKKGLNNNGFNFGREWPYKNVKPRILIEEYMEDNSTKELRDYKFFCFNGVPKIFKIDFNRFIKHQANYYNLNGELLPFGEVVCPPDFNKKLDMPNNLNKMIQLASKLSNGISFLRVDFYEINKKIYFGELTFYPASGNGVFDPMEWDNILGNMIDIKNVVGDK